MTRRNRKTRVNEMLSEIEGLESEKKVRGNDGEFSKGQIAIASGRTRVDKKRVDQIQVELKTTNIELLNRALMNEDAKEELIQIVLESPLIEGNAKTKLEQATYVVEELVGLGEFRAMLDTPFITDISYDGINTHIKTNVDSFIWPVVLDSKYVETIIVKIANATGSVFNFQNPILDDQMGNIRVNAVHERLADTGTSLSLRVSHSKLVLNEGNFHNTAPLYVSDLLKKLLSSRVNMVAIGKTGSGKTEVMKYLLEAIPVQDKIVIIEDINEMKVRELYPDKHVVSFHTSEDISGSSAAYEIKDLLKPALRSNPKWIIVSETRGSEIYQLLQAGQTGHNMITSLHVDTLRGVPNRVISMITEEYPNATEDRIENITLEVFDLGIHLVEKIVGDETIRYIREVVEYDVDGITTLFEQKFYGDVRHVTKLNPLSPRLKDKLSEEGIDIAWPPANVELGPINKEEE